MAGELTDYGERMALDCIYNNEAGPANLYIGLATAAITDVDDLSTITEENDANYARQPVYFDSAQTDAGTTTVQNGQQVEFGPWDVNADNSVTYAFVTEEETGTTGEIIGFFQLSNSRQPLAGEKLIATVGEVLFGAD